jgi:hypothetical protein
MAVDATASKLAAKIRVFMMSLFSFDEKKRLAPHRHRKTGIKVEDGDD